METAALVISIFAVLLSLVVAGFAIGLQWMMFNATTRQLNLIGKENASLGERIAASLGQLHETTTITRSRLDATMDQLVSGLLTGGAIPAEGAGAPTQRVVPDLDRWRIDQAAEILRAFRAAPAMMEYLATDARDARTIGAQLLDLAPQTDDALMWKIDVPAVINILLALELVALDADKMLVSLTPQGKQLAARLSEATHD